MAEQIDSAMIPDERVCIVPVGYDIGVDGDPGCPIIEDANLPNPIANNARYVLANPFGINTPVNVLCEVYAASKWSDANNYVSSSNISIGVRANTVISEGVIIQTGLDVLVAQFAAYACNGHGTTSGGITSAPCRVYVTRGKQ